MHGPNNGVSFIYLCLIQVYFAIVRKIMKPVDYLTYESDTWTSNEIIKIKLTSIEMRFLREIKGKTIKN